MVIPLTSNGRDALGAQAGLNIKIAIGKTTIRLLTWGARL